VLILDEPASGLDPRARVGDPRIAGRTRQNGYKTIFFSSQHSGRCGGDSAPISGLSRGGQVVRTRESMADMQRQLMPHHDEIIVDPVWIGPKKPNSFWAKLAVCIRWSTCPMSRIKKKRIFGWTSTAKILPVPRCCKRWQARVYSGSQLQRTIARS